MQGTRFKEQDGPRPTQPRQSSGAHFASQEPQPMEKRASAPAPASVQVQSIHLPQPVAQTNRKMVTGEFPKVPGPSKPARPAQPRGQAPQQNAPRARRVSPLNSAVLPRVEQGETPESARLRRAVITGASGSMTKIPSSAPARKVSGTNRGYSRYSNGYFERPEARQLTDYVAAFQTEPTQGAPAYSWLAFAVYGAFSIVASVVWVAVAMVSGAAPLTGASPLMLAGLVILACIVVAAFVCAVATSVATLRTGRFEAGDVWASAVGKSALVLLGSLVVWIVCAAIVG